MLAQATVVCSSCALVSSGVACPGTPEGKGRCWAGMDAAASIAPGQAMRCGTVDGWTISAGSVGSAGTDTDAGLLSEGCVGRAAVWTTAAAGWGMLMLPAACAGGLGAEASKVASVAKGRMAGCPRSIVPSKEVRPAALEGAGAPVVWDAGRGA